MSAATISDLLVGESTVMVRLRDLVQRLAPARLPVLVQGPTGAGKELVAQALHLASGRAGRCVVFNACAIPDAMFEDALFGHVRGAFSGASHDHTGYLCEANGGTVFMDEIGSLGLDAQAKLLRAVETRVFRPVGARSDQLSEFRLVTATNLLLGDLVATGRFRPDLAHRISAAVITVPGLAEHPEDIPALAEHFVHAVSAAHEREVELTRGARATLVEQPWPGNVRQLRNVLESAVALAATGRIGRVEVTAALALGGCAEVIAPAACDARETSAASHALERRRLLALLADAGWDTATVARDLGVHRATVYRRMRALDIEVASESTPANGTAAFAPIRANSHALTANGRESPAG